MPDRRRYILRSAVERPDICEQFPDPRPGSVRHRPQSRSSRSCFAKIENKLSCTSIWIAGVLNAVNLLIPSDHAGRNASKEEIGKWIVCDLWPRSLLACMGVQHHAITLKSAHHLGAVAGKLSKLIP